jgi:hypothetical protein
MDIRSSSLTRRTGKRLRWVRHTTTLVGRGAGPASGTSGGGFKDLVCCIAESWETGSSLRATRDANSIIDGDYNIHERAEEFDCCVDFLD